MNLLFGKFGMCAIYNFKLFFRGVKGGGVLPIAEAEGEREKTLKIQCSDSASTGYWWKIENWIKCSIHNFKLFWEKTIVSLITKIPKGSQAEPQKNTHSEIRMEKWSHELFKRKQKKIWCFFLLWMKIQKAFIIEFVMELAKMRKL